jgi:hypothetical protein
MATGEGAGGRVDGEVREAGEQFPQDDAGLQPGRGGPETVVRADVKGQLAHSSPYIELIRHGT